MFYVIETQKRKLQYDIFADKLDPGEKLQKDKNALINDKENIQSNNPSGIIRNVLCINKMLYQNALQC